MRKHLIKQKPYGELILRNYSKSDKVYFSYEELVDLFFHYIDSGNGETLTKEKAREIFNLLPMTNY